MKKTIYFAGGCFWGMEHLMKQVPGVLATAAGYANGQSDGPPDYALVCTGKTGYRETVEVVYDDAEVSADSLIYLFFKAVNPAQRNRQGNDLGTQYQTGIYFTDEATGQTVGRIMAEEARRHDRFYVEAGPLRCFYPAETDHQDYLDKHPGGYCHIRPGLFAEAAALTVPAEAYPLADEAALRANAGDETWRVAREAATEMPFTGAYWKTDAPGIYVDALSGEPLFSSGDKYPSACGWPSFTKPIDPNVAEYYADHSHGMERVEVKSRVAGAHLGHVFEGDPESPNGVRYCINSAALRFIPLAEMEAQGYGAYLPLVAGGK
jgi:peptide methionine sulfoxide reductase msrA/msrB